MMAIKRRGLNLACTILFLNFICTVALADSQSEMMAKGGTYDVGYDVIASGICDSSINHGSKWVRFIANYELVPIGELAQSNFNPDVRKKLVNESVDAYMKAKWRSWIFEDYQGLYKMISNRIKGYVLASDPDLKIAKTLWTQNKGNIPDYDPNVPSTILRVGYLANMTRNYIVIISPINNPAFTKANRKSNMPPFLTDISTPLLKVTLPHGLNPNSPAGAWKASSVDLAWSQSPTNVPAGNRATNTTKPFYYYKILEIPTGTPEGYVLAASVSLGNHDILAQWTYPGTVSKLTIQAE